MARQKQRTHGVLGATLLAAWGGHFKRSYTALGWHAQISKITEVAAGRAAADRAGLTVTHDTLIRWLKQAQEPSAENQRKISEAYGYLKGKPWEESHQTRRYSIHGVIDSGDRIETRTLEIGLGDYEDARWDRIRKEYETGNPNPKKIEEYFIEDVISEDIGDTSPRTNGDDLAVNGWAFPGPSYTI